MAAHAAPSGGKRGIRREPSPRRKSMKRRLPPLNALRVFEAAARHMSFSKAAAEICVTNAAISHQIRLLESNLGVSLFRRHHNRLALTPAGANYVPRIRDALCAIEQATTAIRGPGEAVLKIGSSPGFASKWLVPRLYRFFSLHPQIRLELTAQARPDPAACDLCLGDQITADRALTSEHLVTTDFIPVCSPALGARIHGIEDLKDCMLLHIRSAHDAEHHAIWKEWLHAAGCHEFDASQGLVLSDEVMALQFAMDGQGVMLGKRILVEYDVAAHRLCLPLDIRSPVCMAYYMVHASGAQDHPALSLLKRWLVDEVRAQESPDRLQGRHLQR